VIERWALIRAGVVRDVVLGGELLPQRLAARWDAIVDVGKGDLRRVRAGWTYDGTEFHPPVETLAEAKARRSRQIKLDGLDRIRAVFPAIADFAELQLVRETLLSVAAQARQPTAAMQQAIDIYTAGKAGLDAVAAATTVAAVDAVVVNWP
jgi:hypothetical protein